MVRVYEKGQLEGGKTETDFLNVIGVDQEEIKLSDDVVNPSMNRYSAELNRIYNEIPLYYKEYRLRHWGSFICLSEYMRNNQDRRAGYNHGGIGKEGDG